MKVEKCFKKKGATKNALKPLKKDSNKLKKQKKVPVEAKVDSGSPKKQDAARKGKTKKSLPKSHSKHLEAVKKIDPEFHKFLKDNDKELLDFNFWDSEDDESSSEKGTTQIDEVDEQELGSDVEEDGVDEAKYHKPSDKLEVASDESDLEASGDEDDDDDELQAVCGPQNVTLNLLRQWQIHLQSPTVTVDVIRKVISAFNSTLASIKSDFDQQTSKLPYKVVGLAASNGVIQLCVLYLHPAIMRFVRPNQNSKLPLHKEKRWKKVQPCVRGYLKDLIEFVMQVSSPHITSVLLKHLHQIAELVSEFGSLAKTILKHLIVVWATGDETVRVLAFLCVLRITRKQQESTLNHVLKSMYLSYVRNSKFVSPNTLPAINFMRRSLVEMFGLDLKVSYQHAFLYIRQLAIHLRNAVILKKKESIQAVYNWQFVNSLRLWADLLASTAQSPQLQPLMYPLVTIIINVIRLVPTAQYFPLRFHCLEQLICLAKGAHIHIPVLPLILEVLRSNTFNKKHSSTSMRPMQFTCILRLNKGQLAENGFRDEVVEQVCGLTLEYLAHESSSLAFCDLVVPTVTTLKAYLKSCRNPNHTRKLKQLLDKIQENSRFIEKHRNNVTFSLTDLKAVQAWEAQIQNKRPPLEVYYSNYAKVQATKKRFQAAQTDSLNEDHTNLSTAKKPTAAIKVSKVKKSDGEVELFPSDSEQDDEPPTQEEFDTVQQEKTSKKQKAKKSKKNAVEEDDEQESSKMDVDDDCDNEIDIVKDLDLDDW